MSVSFRRQRAPTFLQIRASMPHSAPRCSASTGVAPWPPRTSAIHRAHLDHHVLVFREQRITPAQQIAFSRRFR